MEARAEGSNPGEVGLPSSVERCLGLAVGGVSPLRSRRATRPDTGVLNRRSRRCGGNAAAHTSTWLVLGTLRDTLTCGDVVVADP